MIPDNDQNIPNYEFEENEISLVDIAFILKRHQRKIIWSTFIIFFGTFLYTFWVKPLYQSTAIILIEESSSSALDIFDMGMGPGKKYLENEKK